MADPFDEYADQFAITLGPYGAVLNFSRTSPKPTAPGSPQQADYLGTIRMSWEHLKAMVFVIKRNINEAEAQLGVTIPVSHLVLNGMKIAPEDWDKFWSREQ